MRYFKYFFWVVLFSGCASIPAHQTRYLNDDDMAIGSSENESLADNPKTYREGSQGGNNGKSGGGCGCN